MSEKSIETREDADEVELNRRNFLKLAGLAGAAAVAAGPAVVEAAEKSADAGITVEEWFQGHFVLMSDEEKTKAIARLEKRYSETYGKKTTVSNVPVPEGVLFGYALDISKCIGCRRCVHACVAENNQSRGEHEIQWIQVLKIPKGNFAFSADKIDKGYPETSALGDYVSRLAGMPINPLVGFLLMRLRAITKMRGCLTRIISMCPSSVSSVKSRPA